MAPCGPLGRGLQILFLEPGSEASRFSHSFSYILISKLVGLGSWSSLRLMGVPEPVGAAWVAWGCLGLSWDSPGALLGPLPGQALWLPAVLWGSGARSGFLVTLAFGCYLCFACCLSIAWRFCVLAFSFFVLWFVSGLGPGRLIICCWLLVGPLVVRGWLVG